MRFALLVLLFISAFIGVTAPATAQPAFIGQCVIAPNPTMPMGRAFNIYSNLLVQQADSPGNAGYAARDPSGQTYLRMPSANPFAAAYFVAWNGQLWEIVWGVGTHAIGGCHIPPPPPLPLDWMSYEPQYGVPVPIASAPGDVAALPVKLVNPNQPFGVPFVATPTEAQQCAAANSDPQSNQFKECMVRAMLGQREEAVYNCTRSQADAALLASCTVGVLGGAKEQQIANDFSQCYSQSNGSYNAMALCMSGKQFDGDRAVFVQCISRQASTGNVSALGTAACYGANKLNLNPETQIIVQCAVATGGEPEAFAGCAGGQLTARELAKCTTGGIGTDGGCFGPNNDIVKYLKSGGLQLAQTYGPLNPLVKSWNEGVENIIKGAREQGMKQLQQAANNAAAAANTAAQQAYGAIKEAMPRITVGKPKVTIGKVKFSL